MSRDFTDPNTVKKEGKKYKKIRQQEMADLKEILELPAGQRFVWRILEQSKMLAPDLFTGNSTTFHNLGKRDLGLWLYNEIMAAAPGTFLSMMQLQLPVKEKDENNG